MNEAAKKRHPTVNSWDIHVHHTSQVPKCAYMREAVQCCTLNGPDQHAQQRPEQDKCIMLDDIAIMQNNASQQTYTDRQERMACKIKCTTYITQR